MNRILQRPLMWLCLAAWLLLGSSARAVLVSTTNGNTDAASLLAAGGPGDPSQPGWVNVGKSSLNGSIVYLGNRWAITAAHVGIGNNLLNDLLHPTPVSFGANSYFVDEASITVLHNPNNSAADLKVFRLVDNPGLPSLIPLINDALPAGRVIMIGRGLSASEQKYWDSSTVPWTEYPAPNGSTDRSGFFADFSQNPVMRWGENLVLNAPVNYPSYIHGFTTRFDDEDYTGTAPLPSEAQATNGDSGGAGFTLVGGQWKLSGIMVNVLTYSNQPTSTAVFGDQTLFADLSVYRDEILAIVPEPASFVLALFAAAGVAVFAGRRKR